MVCVVCVVGVGGCVVLCFVLCCMYEIYLCLCTYPLLLFLVSRIITHFCLSPIFFGPFARAIQQHNCKACDGVFCKKCLTRKMALPKLCTANTVRVCFSCLTELMA